MPPRETTDKSQLEADVMCPSCGARLERNAKFCTQCGARVLPSTRSDREAAKQTRRRWMIPALGLAILIVVAGGFMVWYASQPKSGHIFYPILKWKYATGDGLTVWSPPCVVNQRLYITEDRGYIATSPPQFSEHVYAIDTKDGSLVWKSVLQAREDPYHPQYPNVPIFAKGMVYVTSPSGRVVALNASDGELVWENRLGTSPEVPEVNILSRSKFSNGDFISSPCVANGKVFIGRGTTPSVANGIVYYVSSSNGRLYAMDARDGKILWESVFWELSPIQRTLQPRIRHNGIYALDAVSGRLEWKREIESITDSELPVLELPVLSDILPVLSNMAPSSPCVVGDTIYVGLGSPPCVADGIVLYACRNTGAIYAIDATDGHLIWERQKTPRPTPILVVTTDGHAHPISESYGGVYAIHASNGNIHWKYEIEPILEEQERIVDVNDIDISNLCVENDVVYGVTGPIVFAHNVQTGNLIWEYELPNPPIRSSTITAANHRIYVAATVGIRPRAAWDLDEMPGIYAIEESKP